MVLNKNKSLICILLLETVKLLLLLFSYFNKLIDENHYHNLRVE